jgi:hypothetical protein
MKRTRRLTLAASAFAFAALFSFSWSEQSGIALSIESAEARVGRPLTPVSVAASRAGNTGALPSAPRPLLAPVRFTMAVPGTTQAVHPTVIQFGEPALPTWLCRKRSDKHPTSLRSERGWSLVRLQRVGRLRSPQQNPVHTRYYGQAR